MSNSGKFQGVGKRLKELQQLLNSSRQEMAVSLGVSQAALYKNEIGDSIPAMRVLDRMVKKYGISLDWFLYGGAPVFLKKERDRVRELEESLRREQEKSEGIPVLQEKIDTLEKELEVLEPASKKEADSEGIEDRPEIRELLAHMARVPLLYHELLAHFHRFRKENPDHVESAMIR